MARKKTPEPPPIEIKQFTAQEIERGVTKLRRRINEVGDIDADRAARPESSETHVVASNIHETIREVFGPNSPEFREHEYLQIWAGSTWLGMARADVVEAMAAGKKSTVEILQGLIRRLEEKREDLGADKEASVRAAFEGLDLHPRIAGVATDLYRNSHYAEAVFNSAKALVNYVKERSGRFDLDGAALMRTVFSRNNPVLAFSNLKSQTDLDEQEGMMHLYEGAVLAIRNPGGHDFPESSPERALEYIALLSLLANRLEEANRVE